MSSNEHKETTTMLSQKMKIRWLVAAMTAVLASAMVQTAAAGSPAYARGTADAGVAAKADERYVPGVTDFGTGVFRELEQRRLEREQFIPGVTDSATGVLRELERKRLEQPALGSTRSAEDVAPIGAGAALAAAGLAAGGLALALGMRRRRLAL